MLKQLKLYTNLEKLYCVNNVRWDAVCSSKKRIFIHKKFEPIFPYIGYFGLPKTEFANEWIGEYKIIFEDSDWYIPTSKSNHYIFFNTIGDFSKFKIRY